MNKQQKIDQYRLIWSMKTKRQVEKELESYHKYLAKHPDSFFQEPAPDEMSDADRVNVLKEIIAEKS